MKKFVLIIHSAYGKLNELLLKNIYKNIRVVDLLFLPLLIDGLLCYFKICLLLQKILLSITIILGFSLIIYSAPQVEMWPYNHFKINKSQKYEDMINKMSHKSYLYGLLIFGVFESIYIFTLINSIRLIWKQTIKIEYMIIIVIVVSFLFTIYYFLYHLYINPSNYNISYIKLRVQHYAAIAATFSSISAFVKFDINTKVFISALAIAYLWLQYFIAKEEMRLNKK